MGKSIGQSNVAQQIQVAGPKVSAEEAKVEEFNYSLHVFNRDMAKFKPSSITDQVSIFKPKSSEDKKELKQRSAEITGDSEKEAKGILDSFIDALLGNTDIEKTQNPFEDINDLLDEDSQIDFDETCKTLDIISETINKGVPKQMYGVLKEVANTMKAMNEGFTEYKPYGVPVLEVNEFVA